jgi:hypothetical protein
MSSASATALLRPEVLASLSTLELVARSAVEALVLVSARNLLNIRLTRKAMTRVSSTGMYSRARIAPISDAIRAKPTRD